MQISESYCRLDGMPRNHTNSTAVTDRAARQHSVAEFHCAAGCRPEISETRSAPKKRFRAQFGSRLGGSPPPKKRCLELFNTSDVQIVTEYQSIFDFRLPSVIIPDRWETFRVKYESCNNSLYKLALSAL